jgi:glycosyltransferase involved in cell wall biosynthesis
MAGGARIQRQENHGMGDVNEFVNNRTDMQKLLTIVVPVYKVEPYINKCLDSCLIYKTNEQGEKVLDEELMNQLEVIIVNDGTPDNSAEMSREYVKRYPQTFRQIDKENGGHGSAWNVGLKEATGKYLRFLDSDDWLTNLDVLLKRLDSTDVDMVFTHKRHCYVDGKEEVWKVNCRYEEMDEVAKFPFEANHHDISIGSFMYVAYKTNLLQRYYPLFHEHVYYDDSILFVAPIMCAQTWVAYDIVVYNYLLGREGQTMDPNVLRRNVSYRIDAQDYMNSFCQRFDKDAMNAGVREWIAFVLGKHASYIFPYVVSLPYGKAKVESRKLFSAILQVEKELPSTKMLYRYKKLPFFMFYVLEKIRASKLNTKL